MLAYGVPGDLIDEYVRMSESTCLESLYKFCKAVIAVFGPDYLRKPTPEDTARCTTKKDTSVTFWAE